MTGNVLCSNSKQRQTINPQPTGTYSVAKLMCYTSDRRVFINDKQC